MSRTSEPARARWAGIPDLPGPDATWRLARDGYAFGLRGYRQVGADAFHTRLMGREVVVARGAEAAHVFGQPDAFERRGAIPRSVVHLLQDDGSVQQLEGQRHASRKRIMLDLAQEERAGLVDAFRDAWPQVAAEYAHRPVPVREVASLALTRAALAWAGIAVDSAREQALSGDFDAMVSRAGAIGPLNWVARARRQRTEAWATEVVQDLRARGDRASVAGGLAHHEDEGRPLDERTAAIELLNLLRPTVAVARFIAFAVHALRMHPDWASQIRGGEPAATRWAADEIRRFYPFFPMVGGIASEPFGLHGEWFEDGQWMLLDLYGTDHSPELWERPDVFNPGRFATASPLSVVAQGVGDHLAAHRCPGELATTDLLVATLEMLTQGPAYAVPEQDLRISLRRMPAEPEDGMIVVFGA
ncbi:cytochrome P450 [Microbacterium sp. JZ31]|uniref:cytochrome P450 n=1 Tax=Microbacterium sp. JZ31 TaxID=1906274 RepID=UPI001931ABA7|nr:cytochrome P450 [Microbacterium sp. JZ31]